MSRPKRPDSDDPRALCAAVQAKLDAGRTMSALKDAKDVLKRHPSPAAEDLLARAYAARIADLSGSGMHREAAELVGVARQRFAGREDLWAGVESVAARERGDLSDLLRRWRDEPDARDDVGLALRRHVRDPRWIADRDVLPDDDPLRLAAARVGEAFDQAARGELDDAGREALRAVGRRSPLVPWRAFVLALDAFHRHDDARCREQLAAIADDDAVARGRDVLEAALLDRPLPRDAQLARTVRRLVAAVPDAIAAVEPVMADEALGNTAWFAAATNALRSLKSVGRVPLLRFLRWMVTRCDPDSALGSAQDAGAAEGWLGADFQRFSALTSQHPIERIIEWSLWLNGPPNRARAHSDAEFALALSQIAEAMPTGLRMLPAAAAPVLDALVHSRPIDAQVERLRRSPNDLEVTVGFAILQLDGVFRAAEARSGVRRRGDDPTAEVLRQVVALQPTREAFERLLARLDRGPADDDARDAALAAWAEALPNDPEPLMLRSAAAEARGDFATALELLTRAERVSAVDVRVRGARARLTLGRLGTHWRANQLEACARDLDELEALPAARSAELRPLLLALRETLAPGSTDPSTLAEVGSDARQRTLLSIAEFVLSERTPRSFGADNAELLRNAAFCARICAAIGRPLAMPPQGIARTVQFTEQDLPGELDELLLICEFCVSADFRKLRALAAGVGIRRDGPLLARFLAHRADSMPGNATRRRADCERLARHFAARCGDTITLERLPRPTWRSTRPMGEAEAVAALDRERHAAAAVPKARRPRQRSLRFDSLDDREPPSECSE